MWGCGIGHMGGRRRARGPCFAALLKSRVILIQREEGGGWPPFLSFVISKGMLSRPYRWFLKYTAYTSSRHWVRRLAPMYIKGRFKAPIENFGAPPSEARVVISPTPCFGRGFFLGLEPLMNSRTSAASEAYHRARRPES